MLGRSKSKSTDQPSRPRLTTSRALSRETARTIRKHARLLLAIVLLVAIPANLLSLAKLTSDGALAAYVSFAAMFMNAALIWTIIQLDQGNSVSLRRAYYDGTAMVLQFIMVSLLLALLILPLGLGLAVYGLGAAGGQSTGLAERGLLLILGLIIALPTFLLLPRYLFGFFSVFEADLTPLKALKTSRQAVKGRYWLVLGRLLGLGIILGLVLAVPTAGLILAFAFTQNNLWLSLLQLVYAITLLPIGIIYLYRLYQALT